MPVVEFYLGLGSRYSYLAATQLARLADETGARFDWLPLDSTKLIARRAQNPFETPGLGGAYDWDYRRRDAEAWADYYGVPFREPMGRLPLDPDLWSRACAAARLAGAGEAYARMVLDAVFAEDRDRVDEAACVALASQAGLDSDAFAVALDSDAARAEQDRILRQTVARGAFGVPTFVLDGRLFWGNDRLVLLRHALRGAR